MTTPVQNELTALEAIQKMVSNDPETEILTIFKNAFASMQIICTTYKPTTVKHHIDHSQTYKFHLQFEKRITTPGMLWGHYKSHCKIEISTLNIALSMLNIIEASPTRTVYLQNYAGSKTQTFKLSSNIPHITEYIESSHDFINICFEINVSDKNREQISQYASELRMATADILNTSTMSHAVAIDCDDAPSAPSKMATLYGGFTA